MKILMDGRNRGAGENGKCYGVNIEQPCSLKFLSQTKKLTNKFIKLVLAIFFIVATTGFKYIDKLDDNISRSFVANDITQIDTLELNPHTNIKKQEYESTIKEFRDFMLENQILFDDISREEFKYECNKLIQNSKDRSILDTNLDLQKIMAKLNQGHVQILSYFENSYSNLIVSKFRDGYYIMGSLHDDIIGSKIIAINGHDIEDVMKSIAKYSSAENKSFKENRASQYVMMMNILKRENIINNAKINLTLEKENKKYKRTIEPTTFDKIVLNGFKIGYSEKLYMFYLSDFYENNLGDKFKQLSPIQYFKGNNELYYNELKRNSLIVHYNSAIEYNDGNIYKFIEDFDQKIKKYKPENIIIDLRKNGGGSDYIFYPILMKIKLYQANNPDTKIKLLIGENTYSAAGDNAISTIKFLDNVEIIGKNSGFPVKIASGELRMFYIKNIYTMATFCSKVFSNNYEVGDVYNHNYKNYDYKENTMIPDFYAEESYSDYMIGNDPAMNYALRDEAE